MKLHLPSLKVPFIKSKHLLVLAGIALVVAIVLLGAATAAHDKRVADNKAAQAALVQKQHDEATAKQINDLRAAVGAEDTKLSQVCGYVKSLAAKNKQVVVPVVCQSVI